MSNFKRYFFIACISVTLCFGVSCTKEIGYGAPDTDKWLTEQVESGKMTKAEAEKVKADLEILRK